MSIAMRIDMFRAVRVFLRKPPSICRPTGVRWCCVSADEIAPGTVATLNSRPCVACSWTRQRSARCADLRQFRTAKSHLPLLLSDADRSMAMKCGREPKKGVEQVLEREGAADRCGGHRRGRFRCVMVQAATGVDRRFAAPRPGEWT
ncbi:hypothetical protein BamMC406_6176 [Burkholderia ambifaria MC40-6]|uniref:Uncharacterized protein n=1 Tax=Burkholderia ambifaria (strain MC40-6) TaxID=398577 RepID=B1Z4E7_BURA4|nr:hypothetical protein BamMC406_6176 [Burkholderia ambifaria MC40-6]